MSRITPILMYKCPGQSKGKGGILYQYVGARTSEERENFLSRGWFADLEEAAKDAGSKAYAPVVVPPPKKVRSPGLPSVSHLILAKRKAKEETPKVVEIEQEEPETEAFEPEQEVDFKAAGELLKRFNEDAFAMTKKEHIELGEHLGLKLKMNFKEATMIERIISALE